MATVKGEDLLKELAETPQVLYLRKQIVELEKQNLELRQTIGAQKELADTIVASIVAAEPFEDYKYQTPEKTGSPVTAVILFSDWHIGEIIRKQETEDFGEYDYAIAEKRIFTIVDSFLDWVNAMRSSYVINECAVIGIGDYISGNIHQELVTTNEFPITEQTSKAGWLLGECLRRIAPNFELVNVYEVGADNHGRLQKKPQSKQKALNNKSFLVHTIANIYVEKCTNVKPIVPEGMKYIALIAGNKFLIEHGDTFPSWMGFPYYGTVRARDREARKRMNTYEGFNYRVIGHWHVPNYIADMTIVNGSLSGTNEFDHSQDRHAVPSQVAFLVHPKHGVFNIVPLRCK